jgi:GT2 family glycosyltransferase
MTKLLEVIAFKKYSNRQNYYHYKQNILNFPAPINNTTPMNPDISIVIPIYIKNKNDIKHVEHLLQSISKQTISPDNIIIVDDYSPITYLFNDKILFYKQTANFGPAKARNIGKQIALEKKSDIVAFTDMDCILSTNWIETIKDAFIEFDDFQIISGNTLSYDKNWLGTYHNINGTLNGRNFKNSERLLYGTTANLAMTYKVASTINFCETFSFAAGEDIEFCFRANQSGFAIKHIPTLNVLHNYGYSDNILENIKLFYRQFIRYGKGETILLRKVPEYYEYFNETEEIGIIL